MKKKKGDSPAVAALTGATQGLLFQSETDAPFEAFEWPDAGDGKPGKARVMELAGIPDKTPVKVRSVDAYFADATKDEAWHDDDEKAQVERFKGLVKAIKDTLKDVKVFEAGKIQVGVWIVGRAEKGWAGLKTVKVET
jgi:hypothetical protein